MERIPVNIISGFLGSGKTTSIIQLLAKKNAGEQWAVIINEFGKVAIDSQTLRSSSITGNVYEVSGGCICCSAQGYFHENLDKITKSNNYTRIIVEPSGLGGIDMVTEIVSSYPGLRLMSVICMVDISSLRNARLQMNAIYRSQISVADVILFSKCDLLSNSLKQDQLIEEFNNLFPGKNLHIKNENFNWSILINNEYITNGKEKTFRIPAASGPELSDKNYNDTYFRFGAGRIFESEPLMHYFRDYPDIIRAKGYVRTEKGWNLVNYTLSGCIFEPCHAKEFNEFVIITEKSATVIHE